MLSFEYPEVDLNSTFHTLVLHEDLVSCIDRSLSSPLTSYEEDTVEKNVLHTYDTDAFRVNSVSESRYHEKRGVFDGVKSVLPSFTPENGKTGVREKEWNPLICLRETAFPFIT